jgi:hypothetical protein
MIYVEDSEALIAALLPILFEKRICKGATITVRQGRRSRVMVVPGVVM